MTRFNCSVQDSSLDPKGHRHPHAHILFAPSEPLLIKFEDEEVFISKNQLGFIAPYRFHHCICRSDIIIMNIPEEMIKKGDMEILSSNTVFPLTGSLVPLVRIIEDEISQNPDGEAIRHLYYYLYDKLVETNCFKSLRYIREHFSEDISVSDLAAIENYNVSYYTDWFKKKTGWTPSQYIKSCRMDKAKELLAATDYKLLEIGVQVGYSGNAAFSKAFKEFEGISPLEYRQKIQDNNR